MSFTYDIANGDPIAEVRFKVRDTNATSYLLEDEEIQYLLNKNNGNVLNASVNACYSLWQYYISTPTKTEVDGVRIEYYQRATAYELLYKDLKDQAKKGNLLSGKGVPLKISGVYRKEFDDNRANTTLVRPAFTEELVRFDEDFPENTPINTPFYRR